MGRASGKSNSLALIAKRGKGRKPTPKESAEMLHKFLEPLVAWGQQQRHELDSLLKLPESSAAESGRRTADKLSRKEWVSAVFARRSDELRAMGITAASKVLVAESQNASDCAKPFDKRRYAEKLLRDLGVFPKARRSPPKRRRPK